MMSMMLSRNDCCGYFASFISCLAFGSFAVPIKCKAVRQVNVDPLVLQTYKIVAAFLTCWLVLLVDGVEFSFSPWGLVSGLFMVPGGTAGYYAVQNAGLATSQGIWCSLKVIIAFGWGLFVFHEPVKSLYETMVSIVLMVIGLVGMSYFSSMDYMYTPLPTTITEEDIDDGIVAPFLLYEEADDDDLPRSGLEEAQRLQPTASQQESLPNPEDVTGSDNESIASTDSLRKRRKRWWGIVGAVIDGSYGGSVMVPMHYASSQQTQGLNFLISFSVGCAIVMLVVWMIQWVAYSARSGSIYTGWSSLPSLHVATIGPYAALAGLIWSLGNVSCILSVAFLGQGVGYSIVQSQLLVAGLWGVFWYKEIQEPKQVYRWFLSATVTVCGILLLAQEHISFDTDTLDTDK